MLRLLIMLGTMLSVETRVFISMDSTASKENKRSPVNYVFQNRIGRASDVDDLYAIIEAIDLFGQDIVGISVQYGNVDHEHIKDSILLIRTFLHEMKFENIPLLYGSERSFEHGQIPPELKSFFHNHHEKIDIISMGPLTDAAHIYQNFPQAVNRIFVLMGQIQAGNRNGFTICNSRFYDFNFVLDPMSIYYLLHQNTHIHFIPVETSKHFYMTEDELKRWSNDHNAVRKAVAQITFNGWWEKITTLLYCCKRLPLWDVSLIRFYKWPWMFQTERVFVSIDVNKTPTLHIRQSITPHNAWIVLYHHNRTSKTFGEHEKGRLHVQPVY